MKILIAEDEPILRKSFVLQLKNTIKPTPTIVEAENGIEALHELKKSKIYLVLLDFSMPEMDGMETFQHIQKEHSGTPVIILTSFGTESVMRHFYDLGVHSFLIKALDPDELGIVVNHVLSGKKYFSPTIQKWIDKSTPNLPKVNLAPQEKRVLQLLSEGLQSKQIAERMNLAAKTIDTYRERLLKETKTHNVAELISFGYKTGILLVNGK